LATAARLIGPGRAGRSIAEALRRRGWTVDLLGRGDRVEDAAQEVALVVLAVPDDAIAPVAARIRPAAGAVVLHLSGSRGLDVLDPHPRRGSLHPLASLPDPEVGADRLLAGCTFAVAGDPLARCLAESFGGRALEVPDDRRALYHAAASVAANHLVALAAQVERLAGAAGVPVEAYWPLMADALGNVARVGAAAALTGPAARGDHATVAAHLRALPAAERPLYLALATAAAQLAGRDLPPLDEEPTP
jgi:predicted short-subunit dehydrogenase-like oxidoreductase (DUF2520 family)